MDEQKGRIAWIDVAKGIGILLVCLGHLLGGLENGGLVSVNNLGAFRTTYFIIYSFHMPLFFFLSGLTFRVPIRSNYIDFILHKIFDLMLVYLIWSLIFGYSKIYSSQFVNKQVDLVFFTKILIHPFAHFWFLQSLFIIQVGYGTLFGFFDKKNINKYILLVLLVGLCFYSFEKNFVWYSIFFTWGTLCGPDFLKNIRQQKIIFLEIGATICFLSLVILKYTFSIFQFRGIFYSLNTFALAVIGTFICVRLSSRMKGRAFSFFAYLGYYSLPIYILHVYGAAGVRGVLLKFGFRDLSLHVILAIVFSLLAPIMCFKLLKKLRLGFLFGPSIFLKPKKVEQ